VLLWRDTCRLPLPFLPKTSRMEGAHDL